MKKLLLAVALLIGSISTQAQSIDKPLSVAVKLGLNESSMMQVANHSMNTGLNFGISAKYLLTESMGIESGLYYAGLGCKVADANGAKTAISTPYIQLPIQFLYQFSLSETTFLYPTIGPYLGFGLGSKDVNIFRVPVGENNTTKAGGFDAGLMIGLNLQAGKFLVGAGYQRGLTTLNKDFTSYNSVHNQALQFSVGYIFY